MEIRLSSYGQASTSPSPVSRLLSSFAHDFRDGIDVNLGVGYVNEKTIPVPELMEALQTVGRDGVKYRQAFNYGSPVGSANLIASIRRFLTAMKVGQLDAATIERKRLAIGACGATSILDGLAQVLPPGIVVTSDPAYYIYADVLERKGFEILPVPEDMEGMDATLLERKLRELGPAAEQISFFYVVTVNNPSGTILSNRRRRELYAIAARESRRQKRLIPIFYDLAYELLLHDPAAEPFASVLPEDDLGIAYEIATLSKILAPGLRIGYLLGPNSPFMHAMIEKTSDSGFSAPLFVQEMASYLLDTRIKEQLRVVNAAYREKALAVKAGIERSLGPYLQEQRGGSAGFYFYVTFRDVETHPASPFFRFLTRTTGEAEVDGPKENRLPRVIYIPGEYCVHRQGDLAEIGKRQLRISYGFEDAPHILKALELMREGVEFVHRSAKLVESAR
jgi:DNA-binding transcriptional MocR family regulator